MKVEILYTAWNRLAFTRYSLGLLRRNTDWSLVQRLVVYDDGSTDGTRSFLTGGGGGVADLVTAYEVRDGGWRSTGATMNDYISRTGMDGPEPDAFVKVDNDIALPPGWLPALLGAAEQHPEIHLIGMEAGWPESYTGEVAVTPARHIGGVGLMRVNAFRQRKPIPLALGKNGRAGFTIWQHRQSVRSGWLTPPVMAVQLDRIPVAPWRKLAASYVEKGWARHWDPYETDMTTWWTWMPRRV